MHEKQQVRARQNEGARKREDTKSQGHKKRGALQKCTRNKEGDNTRRREKGCRAKERDGLRKNTCVRKQA